MPSFFIIPYKPTEWKTAKSDLEIDPEWYRERLLERWPAARFWDTTTEYTEYLGLEWSMQNEIGECIIFGLHSDLQIVSMSYPFEEYILWHRQVIPSQFSLYLACESTSEYEYLELSCNTTSEDIKRFLREKT